MDKDYRNQLKAVEISFFPEIQKLKASSIASICQNNNIPLEERSIRSWMKAEKSITPKKYAYLKAFLTHYFKLHPKLEDSFFDYILKKSKEPDYDKLSILSGKNYQEQLTAKNLSFSEKMDLIENPKTENFNPGFSTLQLSTMLSYLDLQLRGYERYFKILNQVQLKDTEKLPWISWKMDKKDRNYMVLSFCSRYNVLLLFHPNYQVTIHEYNHVEEASKKFMKNNDLHMILLFTDQNDITFPHQKRMMEECNLFFEFISEEQLSRTALKRYSLHDINSQALFPKELIYASTIFERLISYYPVVRNEILFETSGYPAVQEHEKDFFSWYDNTILKNIFDYRYLTRHIIYFERKRVYAAFRLLQYQRLNANNTDPNKKIKITNEYLKENKLDLVVELCAPNTFTSLKIVDYVKELRLFSTSKNATNYLKANKIKPDHVIFQQGHISPDMITSNHEHELVGKCDMVILGLGMGSTVENLEEYLRHINSWLKADGVIVISFVNSDSVLLNSSISYNMENTPIQFNDYWEYQTKSDLRFLNRVKTFTINQSMDALKNIDMNENRENYEIFRATYPYLMGLTTEVKDDATRATIREMDQHKAGKQRCGHYITLIGMKSCESYTRENREIIYKNAKEYILEHMHMSYQIISHQDSIDSQNLKKNLMERNIEFNPNTGCALLKTVVLKEKKMKNDNQPDRYIYCVLPSFMKVSYNKEKYAPLRQKHIMKQFGRGTLTPAVILPGNQSTLFRADAGQEVENYLCLIGLEELTQKEVIFSSGRSNESYLMLKNDFLRMMMEAGKQKSLKVVNRDFLL